MYSLKVPIPSKDESALWSRIPKPILLQLECIDCKVKLQNIQLGDIIRFNLIMHVRSLHNFTVVLIYGLHGDQNLNKVIKQHKRPGYYCKSYVCIHMSSMANSI